MTPTPGITALLRHARLIALEVHHGEPATLETLRKLGESIRNAVIGQAAAGLWKDFGVTDRAHISGLRVACVYGDVEAGEPPLKIEWDFSQTRLPNLVVESDSPERPQ